MKITRKELYDLVWAEPMTLVCKRFGLTDNGLRKHCKSMNIPTPPIGYWSKLKHGKKVQIAPLSKDTADTKQSTILNEKDPSEQTEIDLLAPLSRNRVRELEISSGDTSAFIVPEVLYAKDPIIIDTKEKFRQESENVYLKRNPYKNKIGPTLDVYVSEKTIDRALCIFSSIINALRSRGHNVKAAENNTYAAINGEEIQINITERKKQDQTSDNLHSIYNRFFCGELHFNIMYGFRDKDIIKDTAHTKLEDKIISIIANLEIRAEKLKEERIEAEQRRIKREQEERERRNFEERKKAEQQEFKSLFSMAERLHKTNILRHYINTYEEFVTENGSMNEEISEKVKWAKEKADWLDPFIAKKDQFLNYKDIDALIQPECPKNNSWGYQSYTPSNSNSFWSSPYSKWR